MGTQKEHSTPIPVTHIIIILDRSGSMEACRAETISGFNEQVQKICATTKSEGLSDSTYVTLVLFNHEVTFTRFADPVEKMAPIDRQSYVPNGTTAMLDAMGLTLNRLDREVVDTPETNYLVIVITDGLENDSHEFTYKKISEEIHTRRKTARWTFSYMGANQNTHDVSQRLSIPKSNTASFSSSRSGTTAAFYSLGDSSINYMRRRAKGVQGSENFFEQFEKMGSADDDDDDEGSGPIFH